MLLNGAKTPTTAWGAAVTGTVYFFFLNKKGNLTKLWHESGLDWGGLEGGGGQLFVNTAQ